MDATVTAFFVDLIALTVAVPFTVVLTLTVLPETFTLSVCAAAFGAVVGLCAADAAVAELNTTAAAKAVANTLFIAFITFISSFLSKIFMRKFSPLGKN